MDNFNPEAHVAQMKECFDCLILGNGRRNGRKSKFFVKFARATSRVRKSWHAYYSYRRTWNGIINDRFEGFERRYNRDLKNYIFAHNRLLKEIQFQFRFKKEFFGVTENDFCNLADCAEKFGKIYFRKEYRGAINYYIYSYLGDYCTIYAVSFKLHMHSWITYARTPRACIEYYEFENFYKELKEIAAQ